MSKHVDGVTEALAGYRLMGESWTIQDPSPEEVSAAIDGLHAQGNYFAILDLGKLSDLPNNCVFVQAAVLDEDGEFGKSNEFSVELQLAYGSVDEKGRPGPDFRQEQYRKDTVSASEVKELFALYMSAAVPNLTEWENITDKIKTMNG